MGNSVFSPKQHLLVKIVIIPIDQQKLKNMFSSCPSCSKNTKHDKLNDLRENALEYTIPEGMSVHEFLDFINQYNMQKIFGLRANICLCVNHKIEIPTTQHSVSIQKELPQNFKLSQSFLETLPHGFLFAQQKTYVDF